MNKILKPYTIVPSDLYIERSADRQVKSILEDMGRPGYVLVSRQMGKTNLLINARRKYANEEDRFVYVDLSNLFENETQCFRNIIDTAIETNLDVFSELEIKIRQYRIENSELPAHKQHEKELRLLLNSIKGKLIIILDEIDALTKVDYSDRIFSQIRSIYFARTNYEEFYRLSYLLSGVVEPSELIKDPKISPFNIGEKIFLNDFSKSEFYTFILKAGLNSLDEIIKNRIFYWTNGNPRLTWDLCCIIEDSIETIFDETSIDSLVKLHYLTAFDKPPIDNIREIVKKDSLIQDALIEIEYGKGDVISDNIKQKLYLAGIINYTENDVKIKNRIIKESISSQWVNSIRNQEENSLKKGIEFYNERLFKKAIQSIKSYLSQNNNPENNDDFNLSHFYLGLSYYFNNNFGEALVNLNKVNFNPKQLGDLYSKTELFKGYIFQNTNREDEAEEAFENIIKLGINDELYLSAKVNLALVLSVNEINIETSIRLLSEIAESKISDYNNIEDNTFIESKTVALFFLAEIEKNKNLDNYFKYIQEALVISPNKFRPGIIFSLYQSEEDIDKQKEHLDYIIKLIIENNLKTTKNLEYQRIRFNHDLLRLIQLESFKIGKIDSFQNLIDYEKTINLRNDSEQKILDKLIGVAQELNYPLDFIFNLTEFLYNKCQESDFEILIKSLKLLSSINHDPKFNYTFKYLKLLIEKYSQNIDIIDITIFINVYQHFLNKKDSKMINSLRNIGEVIKLKLPNELKNSFLIFDFFEMIYLFRTGNSFDSKKIALSIINELKTHEDDYLKNQIIRQMGIQNIISQCQNVLSNLRKNIPVHTERKIGRNDVIKVRYRNGEEIITKFKKIESDLKNGNCIIIN